MTLASGRLLIGAVRSRDAGRYRCSGYNDVIDARAWSPTAYRLRVVDGRLRTVQASLVNFNPHQDSAIDSISSSSYEHDYAVLRN